MSETTMTDTEYHQLADALMLTIEEQIDDIDADLDYESAAGILEIIFADRSKIVINKQAPLHQVWVATKFNGHHFELRGDTWIDNRSGAEFWQFMCDAASKQAGVEIRWEHD
ncbi:frataxin-like protein [Pseudoalteromonas sp. THAF3]|nr:frataxin-like protein [Pseudoalteromonas sp. THAF3]GAP77075.1 frataxin homolog CyaY [Pseudoalteromonas sp. SW0106-04]|tara:strand:+ start:5042 stop:5377 length:336 start_codon:yes stop_codon:yes gene_type:complete